MINRAPKTERGPSALRTARLAQLLTQHDVARKLGTSQTRWSAIERGDLMPRNLDEARRIATIVRATVEDLWPCGVCAERGD